MADGDRMLVAMLGRWHHVLGAARLEGPLHHKGTVRLVMAQNGTRYVLKEVVKEVGDVPRAERLVSQAHVLRHLQEAGVPVAAPLPTDDGGLFAEQAGRLFTLAPLLPTGRSAPSDRPVDLGRHYERVGAAIARLHRALAAYPRPIPSWRMDLPRRLYEVSLPHITRHLAPERLAPLGAILEPLRGSFTVAFADLPAQPIHGDCHGGNVLLCDGEVSGFIDLDHLPTGPRIYDLASYLADRLKWEIADPEHGARWLGWSGRLVAGYHAEQSLSGRERAALWLGMLAVQTLMVEWFAEHGDDANLVRNLDALHWLAQQRAPIEQRIGEQRGPLAVQGVGDAG